MSKAASRFKNANTKFSERGEYLLPIYREEKVEGPDGKVTTVQVYDSPARYRLEVLRCKWKTSRPPKKSEFYIAEFKVLKSSNPKVSEGSTRTWMQSMDNDAGPTAVPEFMVAALGYDKRSAEDLAKIKAFEEAGELPEMLASTLEDDEDDECENSLEGCIVDVEVKEIITKEKQQKFNRHDFFPVAAESAEG